MTDVFTDQEQTVLADARTELQRLVHHKSCILFRRCPTSHAHDKCIPDLDVGTAIIWEAARDIVVALHVKTYTCSTDLLKVKFALASYQSILGRHLTRQDPRLDQAYYIIDKLLAIITRVFYRTQDALAAERDRIAMEAYNNTITP